MIPTVESIWCRNCGTTQPLREDRMQANDKNDHDATDLLCGTCDYVIATLHHPVATVRGRKETR